MTERTERITGGTEKRSSLLKEVVSVAPFLRVIPLRFLRNLRLLCTR
jgi:hypothetical protein